jgi:hypothetical protein
MKNLQQFDQVVATFTPTRVDDLSTYALPWVGVTTKWSAGWLIDEGPYSGQFAMIPMNTPDGLAPMGWVPGSDLTVAV